MPTRRNLIVTDLDHSDNQEITNKHARTKASKELHTISGNFNRRSRSVDCNVALQRRAATTAPVANGTTEQQQQHEQKEQRQNRRRNGGETRVHELLQTKEQQLTKLLERVATLHNYNEQFATENQQLRADIETLEKRLAHCVGCQQLNTQLNALNGKNKTLIADVEMLKTLVYRLNVQIERYQDRIHAGSKNDDSGGGVAGETQTSPKKTQGTATMLLPEWTTAPQHTLTPLLKAYDELVADKEDLVKQYNQEFEHFSIELKRTLEENTRLLRENETLKRDIGSWREERTCLQAQLEVCRNKAETQTGKCDLARERLVEVMHCYEQKMQVLVLDNEHLQTTYARCKSELAALKSVASTREQAADTLSAPLQECKTMLEHIKEDHGKEQQKLETELNELKALHEQSKRLCGELKQETVLLQAQIKERNEQLASLKQRESFARDAAEKTKRSRDRLKARLRMALQWAQKLEAGQTEVASTYEAVRRLEVVVKHKEAQLRGLHERNIEELERLQKKLAQKDATIRTLLRKKLDRQLEESTGDAMSI